MGDKYRSDTSGRYGKPFQRAPNEYGDRYSKNPPPSYDRSVHRTDRGPPQFEQSYVRSHATTSYPPHGYPPRHEGRGGFNRQPEHPSRSGYQDSMEGGYDSRSRTRSDAREYQREDKRHSSRYESDMQPQKGGYSRYQGSEDRHRRDHYQNDRPYPDRYESGRHSSHEDKRMRRQRSPDTSYDRHRSERGDRMPQPDNFSHMTREAPSGFRQDENTIIEDTVFVSNLPTDATVSELANLFGSLGVIKMDKRTGFQRIKIYAHPDGNPKGEACVSFDDSHAARAAIKWFNQTDFRGQPINVQMAERTFSASFINNTKSMRGGFSGGRGNRGGAPPSAGFSHARVDESPSKPPFIQAGDWACSNCKNNNFSWRKSCNRCNTVKDEPQGSAHGSYRPPPKGTADMPPQYPDPRMNEYRY